ncbi:hypothetical protein OIO90_000177 [Microbotryomycetes sp. JL221]|nr:hypothetical protein OIO90_000177 [Microbotryomycetes sp. JL221]
MAVTTHETGHRTRQRTTGARQCWRPVTSAVEGSSSQQQHQLEHDGAAAASWTSGAGASSNSSTGESGSQTEFGPLAATTTSTTDVPGAVTRNRKLSMTMAIHADQYNSSSILPTPPLTAKLGSQDFDPLDSALTPTATHDNINRGTVESPHLTRQSSRLASMDVSPNSASGELTRRHHHSRDSVMDNVGFPTAQVAHLIKQEDLDDRFLMAVCAVLHAHDNRALCPKEIAEVMLDRKWLSTNGPSPFTHISACIRSHIRRAAMANPPYLPILRAHDLAGSIPNHDVPAVGLRAEDRPAIKRGTLWYLDENALGRGVGADDPFVKCRLSQGLAANGAVPLPASAFAADQQGDDDDEMGRGKRKRRISSAALASWSSEYVYSSSTGLPSSATASPIAAGHRDRLSGSQWSSLPQQQQQAHRRSYSMSVVEVPQTEQAAIPKLRLRLSKLEEAPATEDSDGFSSDAAFYRSKTKKKIRNRFLHPSTATSSRSTSPSPDSDSDDITTSDEDEDEDSQMMQDMRVTAFSSVTSSALLAQSLLAASAPPSQSTLAASDGDVNIHVAITPGSLNLETTDRSMSHLSISAPSLFSSFPSYQPVPTTRAVIAIQDKEMTVTPIKSASPDDSGDEGDSDAQDATLPGEEFDFEWGAASYGTSVDEDSVERSGKDDMETARSREPSLGIAAEITFDGIDAVDSLSTPATTPRSPAEEPEVVLANCTAATADTSAMDVTLCEAFEDESSQVEQSNEDSGETSFAVSHPAVSDVTVPSTPKLLPLTSLSIGFAGSTNLAIPLPSPLAFEQAPIITSADNFSNNVQTHEASEECYVDLAEADDEDEETSDESDNDDDEASQDQLVTIDLKAELNTEDDDHDIRLRDARTASWRSSSSRASVAPPSSPGADSISDHGLDFAHLDRCPRSSSIDLSSVGSPTDALEWQVNMTEFSEFGPRGDNQLLGPEDVGLEELDLAWDQDEEDCNAEKTESAGIAEAEDELTSNDSKVESVAELKVESGKVSPNHEADEELWRAARNKACSGGPVDAAYTAARGCSNCQGQDDGWGLVACCCHSDMDDVDELMLRPLETTPTMKPLVRARPRKTTSSSSIVTIRRSRRRSSATVRD